MVFLLRDLPQHLRDYLLSNLESNLKKVRAQTGNSNYAKGCYLILILLLLIMLILSLINITKFYLNL